MELNKSRTEHDVQSLKPVKSRLELTTFCNTCTLLISETNALIN